MQVSLIQSLLQSCRVKVATASDPEPESEAEDETMELAEALEANLADVQVATIDAFQVHNVCTTPDRPQCIAWRVVRQQSAYAMKLEPDTGDSQAGSDQIIMQGMEKDLIILCTAVTRPGAFAADKQRLNVALTRGRHHLLLIGHGPALQVPHCYLVR